MLVVNSVGHWNVLIVPVCIASLVPSNQEKRASTRVKGIWDAVWFTLVLDDEFLHVRMPRRSDCVRMGPR
jgi:hypothetical protein